jgi:osmotically-inducible protein OsmY
MSKLRSWLITLGLGAGLMYFYDPEQGRRRRAGIRDQVDSLKSRSDDAIEKTARDLQNRTRGWLAEARALVSRQEASDWVVSERARSKIGFLTSHPGSIEVDVQDGTAILSGPILADEVDKLVSGISKVPGIRNVENKLQVV